MCDTINNVRPTTERYIINILPPPYTYIKIDLDNDDNNDDPTDGDDDGDEGDKGSTLLLRWRNTPIIPVWNCRYTPLRLVLLPVRSAKRSYKVPNIPVFSNNSSDKVSFDIWIY